MGQPQAICLVLVNVLDGGLDIHDAIRAIGPVVDVPDNLVTVQPRTIKYLQDIVESSIQSRLTTECS
jgi:hypothetical protein